MTSPVSEIRPKVWDDCPKACNNCPKAWDDYPKAWDKENLRGSVRFSRGGLMYCSL